ncbi:uncharacterized protein LOC127104517 [Lathyrus oleraceus]|uniref:uncharacterized protein LOC127104517 n=1 Tax=Pisum sativum TaxID=3888 RepID=UPI0021CEB8B6|nr:uncharacterized protein LOC127104517 [Pisum sativum]
MQQRQRLKAVGIEITWAMFISHFREKYFPKDVHNKKEIEFLEMKQGNSIVVEYVDNFEESVKFCPYYNNAAVERSKSIKFESGLRSEIKKGICYREIHRLSMLVNKCRIYDEDNIVRPAHYKSFSGKKENDQTREKPYSTLADKGKQKVYQKAIGGKERSGRGNPTSMRCFKHGDFGHRAPECKSTTVNCFKCGKPGHRATGCRSNNLT